MRQGDGANDIDVAGFALVDAHARCGVAFDVLNRTVAFTQGQMDVGHRHVVLKVDEGLVRGAGRLNMPQRLGRLRQTRRSHRKCSRFGDKALIARGGPTGRGAVLQCRWQVKTGISGAGAAGGLMGFSGDEGRQALVIPQLATRLGKQVEQRVPATRDGQQITVE